MGRNFQNLSLIGWGTDGGLAHTHSRMEGRGRVNWSFLLWSLMTCLSVNI